MVRLTMLSGAETAGSTERRGDYDNKLEKGGRRKRLRFYRTWRLVVRKVGTDFGGTCSLNLYGSALCDTLKVDAADTSETSVLLYQSTHHHVPDDRNVNTYLREDLQSHDYKYIKKIIHSREGERGRYSWNIAIYPSL